MIELADLKTFDTKDKCVAIGKFDVLHLGHQKIIKSLIEYSKKKNLRSTIILIDVHETTFWDKASKIELLTSFGIEQIVNLDFNTIKNKNKQEFIDFLINNNVKNIFVGHDFLFGYNKSGNVNDLMNFFEVHIMEDVKINNEKVSSSLIRKFIKNSDITKVNEYLGFNYFIKNIVYKDRQLGRTINFPTANIELGLRLEPPRGVYVSKILIKNKYFFGMTNVGQRPTVDNNNCLKIETNIFNFNDDIYNDIIKVELINKIRDEVKFNSIDELKSQLEKDKTVAKNFLKENVNAKG